jgi:hypothetical protein
MEIPCPLPAGITRHDYGRTRGFLARVYVGGQCSRRLFSYDKLGGEIAALEAALCWQSQTRQAPEARKQSGGYGYVQRGLRSYRTVSGEVRYYDAFIAWFWDEAGKAASTSFGIRAQGHDRARELCDRWLAGMQAALPHETTPSVSVRERGSFAEAM